MIHFQHPQILWFLLLVPAFVALWIFLQLRGRKRLEQFADTSMFGRLIPDASRWRPALKFSLIMLAMASLILAIANPQQGSKMSKGERLGSDVAICLDISNSMMAEDIQPNRLERSKRIVNNLLSELTNDRVSLVVFAGSSYIQMPLTSDYSAVKLFLDQIDCGLISVQGTAIGDAIGKAMETFGYGDSEREWVKNQGRMIVVISDGENFEDDARAAAREAANEGVRVCTIGMGLPDGTPIPAYRGNQRIGYKHDAQGNTVTTRLDEATLTDIAHAGKGVYVRATSINSGIQEIVNLIEILEKENYGEAIFSEYESRYQYPLGLALLCLIAELLIFERRNKRLNLDRILNRRTMVLSILLTLSLSTTAQHSTAHMTRQGNRHYRAEKYDKAEIAYRRALQSDSNNYRAHYNLGNALYRQKKYDEAAQHYERAASHTDLSRSQRSQILHNKGNSYLQAGLQKESRAEGIEQFRQAVQDYQEALKLNPKNDNTRYNLSYAKKLLQQAQQQQQQQGGGQDNQDQQNQDNKDKQGNQGQDKQQQQQQQDQGNRDQQQQKQNQQGQQSPQQKKQEQQRKQDAERLLEAVKNNEKNSMKENAKKVEVASPGRIEKDW